MIEKFLLLPAFALLLLLQSCINPDQPPPADVDTAPYVEGAVKEVIRKDENGQVIEVIVPANNQITVYPLNDFIELVDPSTGKTRRIKPSWSVVYDR